MPKQTSRVIIHPPQHNSVTMVFQHVLIEPYVITFKKTTFTWNLFKFLNNANTQTYWCSKLHANQLIIDIRIPEQWNTTPRKKLDQQIKRIFNTHKKTILIIRINTHLYYINYPKAQQLLTILIIILLIITGLLWTTSLYLDHLYTTTTNRSRDQQKIINNTKHKQEQRNQTHNHTIIKTINKAIKTPHLYTESILITPQKTILSAYYQQQYETQLLKKLWKTKNIKSQTYNINPLKNKWRNIRYVWHTLPH